MLRMHREQALFFMKSNRRKNPTAPFKDLIKKVNLPERISFFYLGFLSQPFTNHRTAGEGGGHFFNFSLPLPPDS